MTNSSTESKDSKVFSLQWKWIIIGLFFGLVTTVIAIDLTTPNYPGTIIPSFIVMVIGFLVMGVLVGYLSPGVTIKESVVSGILMIVVFIILLFITKNLSYIPTYYIIIAFVIGFIFSLIGGWIGEVLQVKSDEKKAPGLQWKWIIVAVVLGFVVSNFFLLILAPKYSERTILYLLSIGFIITGLVVGQKSPGVTIIEAAIGGAVTAILDYLFLIYLQSQNIPIYIFTDMQITFSTIILVFIFGLILSLLGSWIGEAIQHRQN